MSDRAREIADEEVRGPHYKGHLSVEEEIVVDFAEKTAIRYAAEQMESLEALYAEACCGQTEAIGQRIKADDRAAALQAENERLRAQLAFATNSDRYRDYRNAIAARDGAVGRAAEFDKRAMKAESDLAALTAKMERAEKENERLLALRVEDGHALLRRQAEALNERIRAERAESDLAALTAKMERAEKVIEYADHKHDCRFRWPGGSLMNRWCTCDLDAALRDWRGE